MVRNYSIDLLKILMAFFVVAQHANFLSEYSGLFSYVTVNGVFRIAVPMFLIVSGYYFQKISTIKDLLGFVKRLLVMYFFWLAAYAPFWFDVNADFAKQFKIFLGVIFLGYWHLWYMAGLILSSITLYFLRELKTKFLISIILVLFVVGVFIQYSGNYNIFENSHVNVLFNQNWVHRNFLFFCFPFLALGLVIRKHIEAIECSKIKFEVYLIFGIFFLICESYFNYIAVDRVGGFDNYFSLIFVCPLLFIVIRGFNFEVNVDILYYSSGVYFVHMFFVFLLARYFAPTSLTIFAFVFSLGIVFFIKKYFKYCKFIF